MPIKQVIVPQAQQTNSSITEVIQQYEVHQHNSETCYSGPKGVQSRLASLWLFFFSTTDQFLTTQRCQVRYTFKSSDIYNNKTFACPQILFLYFCIYCGFLL